MSHLPEDTQLGSTTARIGILVHLVPNPTPVTLVSALFSALRSSDVSSHSTGPKVLLISGIFFCGLALAQPASLEFLRIREASQDMGSGWEPPVANV